MNPEETKNSAEQWLDEALARYSAAEPRVGLETRMLANLQAHAAQGQRRWIFALAGVAGGRMRTTGRTKMRTKRTKSNPACATQAPPPTRISKTHDTETNRG